VRDCLPPLRDRRDDICLLVAAFVKQFAKRFDKPIVGLTPAAEQVLQQRAWPGNVRELRNTLERACMLSDGRMLGERDIVLAVGSIARPNSEDRAASPAAHTRTAEGRTV
jgi:DNA-binding NtrC family response regulator